jgi:hypothetical protein
VWRNRRSLLVISLAIAVLGAAGALGADPAASGVDVVRDCRTFDLKLGAFIHSRSVRNMTCARAGSLTRRSYGPNGFHFRAARRAGFSCQRIGSVQEGTTYRCAKRSKAFRFAHGS